MCVNTEKTARNSSEMCGNNQTIKHNMFDETHRDGNGFAVNKLIIYEQLPKAFQRIKDSALMELIHLIASHSAGPHKHPLPLIYRNRFCLLINIYWFSPVSQRRLRFLSALQMATETDGLTDNSETKEIWTELCHKFTHHHASHTNMLSCPIHKTVSYL